MKRPIHKISARLSLCMIVKNEANHLEKCLSTARPHVDEIVVVDTGSTDGTQVIARRYADVFDEIEWPDSFAAARNHSFDLSSGDFNMWLDGDEHLPDPEHWDLIHLALRKKRVIGLQLRLRNELPEAQILEADYTYLTRVVQNHPDIRFKGRVHNQIDYSLNRYARQKKQHLHVLRVPTEVIHVGYALSKDKMQAKYRARLHLLEYEVEHAEDASTENYYRHQLGNALFMLKEYRQAAAVLEQVEHQYLGEEISYFSHLMAAEANRQIGHVKASLLHADAMFEMDRSEPIAYFFSGLALLKLRHPKEAVWMLIRAYELSEEHERNVKYAVDRPYLLRVLADVCTNLQLLDKASFFYREYLEKYPDDEQVAKTLEQIKVNQRHQETGSATPSAMHQPEA